MTKKIDKELIRDRINELESKKRHIQSHGSVMPLVLTGITIMVIFLIFELQKEEPSVSYLLLFYIFILLFLSISSESYKRICKKENKYNNLIKKNYDLLLNRKK